MKHVCEQGYLPGCRVGLVSPIGFKIDFKGVPYFLIGCMIFCMYPQIFVCILKFIFTSIFETDSLGVKHKNQIAF